MTEKPDLSPLLPDDATVRVRRGALETELARPRRRRRRVRRRLAVVVIALVAVGGGAAWAAGVFSAKEISFAAGVGCYSEARLNGPNLAIAIFHAAADPIAKCERLWGEGVIDTVQRRLAREGKIDYPKGPYPPPLVACARPDSPVAVFPGGAGVCEELGLKPLPGDYGALGREAARAYAAWHVLAGQIQIRPENCSPPQRIAARARDLLRAHDYGDVRVLVSGSGPCAKAVEPRGRTVDVLTAGHR
jgi:hypothetical protein